MLDVDEEGTNEENPMSGSQRTSIEELVMDSARGLFHGHPLAWDLPGGDHPSATAPRTARRGRIAGILAARRGPSGSSTPVAAEAGGCG